MLKIIDLICGETVISELDEEFVETQFLEHIAAEYAEDLPEFFWLSPEAVEGIIGESNFKLEEGEELPISEAGDPVDTQEIVLSTKIISEELKNVLIEMLEYINNNSNFIDSDGNDLVDINEKGCYFAFESFEESAEYKVFGKIERDDMNVPGLRVQLYDDELISDDFIGFGFTDADGCFEVEFHRENFSKDPLDFKGIPDLYLTVSEFDTTESEFKILTKIAVEKTYEKINEVNINL